MNTTPFYLTLFFLLFAAGCFGSVVERVARSTVTPVELDHGDELRFTLHSGETRVLRLDDSGAQILLSNVYPEALMQDRVDHGILYKIWADVTIDGQALRLTRYLSSQASFNEPYVVNGMRIWLDYIRAPSGVFMRGPVGPFPSNRGGYPQKEARFVVNDLTDRICPEVMVPWYRTSPTLEAKEFAHNQIDARDTYKGDNMHMAGYWGATPHRGLDINMPVYTRLVAPIAFDTHEMTQGHRWRGFRDWGNGSSWQLRAHHTIGTVVPQNAPLERGTYYADAAGVNVGEVEHAHFEFWITEYNETHPVDPWLLFWQMFRDRSDSIGAIKAKIMPLAPAAASVPVTFSSEGSRPRFGSSLRYSWTFGDGAASVDKNPTHTFLRPGIYPVILTVEDAHERAMSVQWITVSGEPSDRPGLALKAPDEVEFTAWPAGATRTFGESPAFLPHTLAFTARSTRPRPDSKWVELINNGGGGFAKVGTITATVEYEGGDGKDWCLLELTEHNGGVFVEVSVDASGMAPGTYNAVAKVEAHAARNSPQHFRVRLVVTDLPPRSGTFAMTNDDEGFFATPWFWVPHSFHVNHTSDGFALAGRWDRPLLPPALLTPEGRNRMGLSDRYLTNGYRTDPHHFFRFQPDLAAGVYEVFTPEETPWDSNTEVDVRVRHANGDTWVRYRPGIDRTIGVFEFSEGRDGFVAFYAEESVGQVSADALVFSSDATADGAPGMIVHWPFNDFQGTGAPAEARDSVRDKRLVLAGLPGGSETWVPGRMGDWALRLPGDGGHATAGSLGLPPGGPRTISAWVRSDAEQHVPGSHVFGFSGSDPLSSFRVAVASRGDRLVVDTNGGFWTIVSRINSEWTHLTVTWDGSTIARYVNGTLMARFAYSPFGLAIDDRFMLGEASGGFEGAIDDVRVFNRALTNEEIRWVLHLHPRETLPGWRHSLDEILGGPSHYQGSWLATPVGFLRGRDFPWIIHRDLGQIYLENHETGLWFWSGQQGWVWTRTDGLFPYLWLASEERWIVLMHELDAPGWLYHIDGDAWEKW